MFAMNSSATMRSAEGDILPDALNGIARDKVSYCAQVSSHKVRFLKRPKLKRPIPGTSYCLNVRKLT